MKREDTEKCYRNEGKKWFLQGLKVFIILQV